MKSAFACLQQPGLKLQLPKCQFGLDRVYYLGHIIGGGELQLDPKKLETVAHFKRPEMKKDYWKFIPDFVSIATPLTDLLKNKQPERVEWTQQCEEAFSLLKESSFILQS